MAARIEDLQRDTLLTRYMAAAHRYATRERLSAGGDLMLARYLRAVERHGMELETAAEDLRTCTHCGQQVHFNQDSDGGWGVCSACGELA